MFFARLFYILKIKKEVVLVERCGKVDNHPLNREKPLFCKEFILSNNGGQPLVFMWTRMWTVCGFVDK